MNLAQLHWIRSVTRAVGLSAAYLSCAACFSIPGPSATPEQIAALKSFTYQASDMEIGALRSENPSHTRIVYVHGSPGNAESWADFLVQVVPETEGIALDRPGYGRSDHGPVVSLKQQALAIRPLLVERKGQWPILVGHSLGGPIIAQVAIDNPGMVAGLVIVSGSLDPQLERLRWFNYVGKGLSWIIPTALHRSNQEMWPLKRELKSLALSLDRIACPVYVIHGKEDELVPFANVDFMHRAISSTSTLETLVLDGVGHFIPWEEPSKGMLRDAIAEMVRETQSDPGTASHGPSHSRINGFKVLAPHSDASQ